MGRAASYLFTRARAGEHRFAMRRPVKLRCYLRDRGSPRFAVDVLDLSTLGFRAETIFNLRVGSIVWLTLPGLAGLEAKVAWRDKRTSLYGCAFKQPLHPAVLDHMVAIGTRGCSVEQA